MAALEQWDLLAARMRELNEQEPGRTVAETGNPAPAGAEEPDARHREELRRWFAGLVEALPAAPVAAQEIDELADRWLSYSPGQAEPPSAPSGEKTESGTMLVRVVEGKAIAGWFVEDPTGLLPEIALVPQPD